MLNQKLIDEEYGFFGDVAYLDISLTSMPPMRVRKAWKEFIEGYVTTFGVNAPTYFPDILTRARKEMATLMQVDPSEIAFTHGTGDGMTKLANSYPFEKGDNVIITEEEHASNAIPWLGIEQNGVEIRFAESENGVVPIENIVKLMDEKTKIVSTASTYFCSGYAINLKELGAECAKRGIVLAVDAIQSMGRLKMRPKEWNISYVAGGAHKGCLGTKGTGYVYCSSELSKILKPYTGSLQSLTNGGRPFPLRHYDEIDWLPDAGRLEGGMYTFGVIESLAGGVSLINELGIENVEAHIHEMEELLRSRIADLPLKVVTPPEGNRSGLLFIYHLEKADPKAVEQVLLDYKVRATVRQGYIRMGLHFYNSAEQMERVAKALHEIAKL